MMGKNKNHRVLKITIVTILLLVIVIAALGGYYFYKTKDMKRTHISKKSSDLGISQKTEKSVEKYNDIYNIAFFGLDRRNPNEASRSDTMMIATIDGKHDKIKFSSIMRDTYVSVQGHGMTKITHAYAYGGPQLAIKTINQNFNLNIKDYVTVDFFGMEKIIDKVGGINIDITPDELKYINNYITEVSNIEKVQVQPVTKAGNQILDGRQAVAYSRIRYTAGGDFERTERQRTVITAVINKIKGSSKKSMVSIVNELIPYVETSMSNTDIIKYSLSAATSKMYNNIEQERFPVDGYCNAMTLDGIWYLKADLNAATDQMHKFIFEDTKPVSKTPLF